MKLETSPVKPGDMIAGKYRVDRILGQGGMGVVVAATHVELREVRALKFLLASAYADGESVERFRREARAVLKLKSEHVARVLDVGKLESGAPFMVMEYLQGTDLGAAIKDRGPIPLENAVLYVIQTLDAVAEAHAKGIIHRDLKPANLFLTTLPSGQPCVKVLDFGISKTAKESKEDVDMTKTHAVLGSPQFMSPEQMRASRDVDARADIWSIGVILYQLTTGKVPFRGRSSTEIIANMFSTRPDPPSRMVPSLPTAFDEVVMRCLRLDAADRFATVADLAKALAPFAPASASFTLERIGRYANADERRKAGAGAVIDGGPGGSSEDFFTPNPELPGDWIKGSSSGTNETISSAPTRVMPGAAIPDERLSTLPTQVMSGAPNHFGVLKADSTEVMNPAPARLPAKTDPLPTGRLPHERSKTEVMPKELLQAAPKDLVIAANPRANVSMAGTNATAGRETISRYGPPVAQNNRVGYVVVVAAAAVLLVVIALVVALSGDDSGPKPSSSGTNPTSSAPRH